MSLTRVLFPLALISLLITIASANDEYNPSSSTNPETDLNKYDHDDQSHQSPIFDLNPKYPIPYSNGDSLVPEFPLPSYPIPEGHENIDHPAKPYHKGHGYKNIHVEGLNYKTIIIQGVILCNSGSSYTPLEGAIARITCTDSFEYENTHIYSILSPETDENGYFCTPLNLLTSDSEITDIKMCKVYLEHSSSETCNVPTKSGIIGAPLSLSLGSEVDKIYYTMGTLFYSSETSTSYSTPKKDLKSKNNGY